MLPSVKHSRYEHDVYICKPCAHIAKWYCIYLWTWWTLLTVHDPAVNEDGFMFGWKWSCLCTLKVKYQHVHIRMNKNFKFLFFSVLHIFIGWVSTLLLAFTCTCTCTCTCTLMDMQLKIGNSVITENLSFIVKCREQCLWCSLLSFSLISDQGVWYM